MPQDAISMRAVATPPSPEPGRRKARFWRGLAGAVSLAAWSAAGVVGAVLALLPAALEGGPRGRVRTGGRIGRQEPAAPVLVPGGEAPEPARAVGEVYPG